MMAVVGSGPGVGLRGDSGATGWGGSVGGINVQNQFCSSSFYKPFKSSSDKAVSTVVCSGANLIQNMWRYFVEMPRRPLRSQPSSLMLGPYLSQYLKSIWNPTAGLTSTCRFLILKKK